MKILSGRDMRTLEREINLGLETTCGLLSRAPRGSGDDLGDYVVTHVQLVGVRYVVGRWYRVWRVFGLVRTT